MENILNTILNTENVRTLAIIVSVLGCFVWQKMDIKHKLDSFVKDLKMDINNLEHKLNSSVKDLKIDINNLEHKLDSSVKDLRHSIKELELKTDFSINDLKSNDLAHLSTAFAALTYVLEKNNLLSKEDKEFVDSRLAL